MCTNNKMCIKNWCIWGKIHSDIDKISRVNMLIFVCCSNIYIVNMCKSKIVRNWLFGYLGFKLVIGNLEITDKLTGYSVKVHSTSNKHALRISNQE